MKHFIFSCSVLIVIVACGAIKINNGTQRITNGYNAHSGQYPFMTSVFHNTAFICSGVLLSSRWILTTAECIWPYHKENPSKLDVNVGGLKLYGPEPGRYTVHVQYALPHPEFEGSNSRGDYLYYENIALLYLQTSVILGNNIQPAMLPYATEEVNIGSRVTAIGWGGDNELTPSPVLQYSTEMTIMDIKQCAAVIQMNLGKPDICINYGGSTTCKFDHGGPLIRNDPVFGYVVLGVLNYAPCGLNNLPSVYSSVIAHRYWIATMTLL